MPPLRCLAVLWLSLPLLLTVTPAPGGEKHERVAESIEKIDRAFDGNLGVYIVDRANGEVYRHRVDRDWYLASTIKIPLAIVVLQAVEAGEVALDHEIRLERTDYVDGTGELLYAEPGDRFTVEELVAHAIGNSDSTATDMLIRLLGEDAFNRTVREGLATDGVGRITTIVQVRHDVYSEVHPAARKFDNMDFIDLKTASGLADRYLALLDKLGIERGEARVADLETAFERYYNRGLNSGSLVAMGKLLGRLVDGELLNAENTRRLLDSMKAVTTGDDRIKAGLPKGTAFAHKTGTQVRRSCNMGIVHPDQPKEAVIVAVCAEKYDRLADAERAMVRIGELTSVLLHPPSGDSGETAVSDATRRHLLPAELSPAVTTTPM